MHPFWKLTRQMMADGATLAWALVFAFVAAIGLGVGLLSVGTILGLILEQGQSLVDLAVAFNDEGHLISIPEGLVGRLPEDRFEGVALILAGLAVLTVLGAGANFLHQYLSQTVATKTVARIRQEAFENVLHLPLTRVITRGPSEFVARIVRDAAELQRGFIALSSKAVAQVTRGLAAFVVALVINWQLSLIALLVAPVLIIVIRRLGRRVRRGTRGSLEAQEGLLRVATEYITGLRAVKVNTGEAEAQGRFGRLNEAAVKHELRVRTARSLLSPIVETLAVMAVGVLALLAAKLIIDGTLAASEFLMAIGALAVAGASLRPLAGLVAEIQAASAPAERLNDILIEPRETDRGVPLGRPSDSIAFEDVTFTYPGADRPALDDVSLLIRHGERVAFVGPNGSGKTTLVSLLPRLLTPQSGRVLIDGIDIAGVSLHDLRRQIGVVTQETVLFRGTIAQNIAFGAKGVSREQIRDAARRAHAEEFILALRDGYDAGVLEQAASLSGGQRQRLAIARAILRDPSILILDEATSQIDAESEAHITAALTDFCRGRTSLLVAHRLATVLNADRIVVMDAGRVIDQGTHDKLLERCELYRRLTRTQLVPTA